MSKTLLNWLKEGKLTIPLLFINALQKDELNEHELVLLLQLILSL